MKNNCIIFENILKDELINHLGNVLAVIIDRSVVVPRSGGIVNDLKGDISNVSFNDIKIVS